MKLCRVVSIVLTIISGTVLGFAVFLGLAGALDRSEPEVLGGLTMALAGTGLAALGMWLHSLTAI